MATHDEFGQPKQSSADGAYEAMEPMETVAGGDDDTKQHVEQHDAATLEKLVRILEYINKTAEGEDWKILIGYVVFNLMSSRFISVMVGGVTKERVVATLSETMGVAISASMQGVVQSYATRNHKEYKLDSFHQPANEALEICAGAIMKAIRP